MAETTNFTSLQTIEGYIGDVTGNVTGDTFGTHTGDVKTSSIQDLDGTQQIGVSASGVTVASDLTIQGNLIVQGGETLLNTQTLEVEDFNIVIGNGNETSSVLNGQGITLHGGTGTDITFQYGSNGYMYLSNKLQVSNEVKTASVIADSAEITNLQATLTGDVIGNVTGQVSDISNHSTTNLAEGSNLYWTPARSDARISLQTGANLDLSQKSTTELSEGTNLYYTEARVDANIASKSTDDLAEGSNLYFTDARVQANRLDEMSVPTTNLDMNSVRVTNVATPVQDADATTKLWVEQRIAEKDALSELSGTTDDLTEGTTNLFLTPNAQTINGNKTFTGTTSISGTLIVPTPVSGTQAANKDYVDNAIASIDELSELLGTTDNITEGSTNLFFTDARVHSTISGGTGVTYDGAGEFSIGQPVGTADSVSFKKVYVREGTGVGVDLNSQTNNASLRFHTSNGQTGIISTTNGNAPVQVYSSLLWARAINGGTGDFMADRNATIGGNLSVTGTISSPTITALEASISGDVTALQSELDTTQTGAGLDSDGSYLQNTGANFIQASSSLADADNDLDTALKAEETARVAGDASTLSSANSYTDTSIANLVDSAPATLDTLNELAAALADDPNFATTITNQIATVQTNLDSEIATTDAEVTALQAQDVTLQSNIDNEAATRASADTTLQSNIDSEASTRAAADTTLQSNIDAEAATRSSADSTLQSNIDTVAANLASEISATDAEVTALQAADVTLQSNIDAEETARQSADTTLQSNIDSEASTRAAADTTLQSNIDTVAADLATEISATDTEVTALQAADVTLQANIDSEESARQSADTTLQSNIDSEAATRASADTTLQSNIDTEEAARIAGDAATLAAAKAYSDSLDHDTAQLEADVAQLQTDLTTETSNRTSADSTLQSNIDTVAANLATEIATTDSEISALQAADTAEASARAAADTTLQSNIDTVAANLASEISTTNSEISALQAQDTTLQSNIDTEEAARIAGDASTLSSAQSYTDTAVANLVDSAPATLDTLNELAAALGDDPNFATTITTSIGTKLATADFDSTFDTRLATKTTSDLTEGSNLYYTDARVASYLSSGASIDINSSLNTGDITIDAGGDEAKLTFVLETNGGADTGSIIFTRDSGGADIGAIKYVRSQDSLNFYTNGTSTADVSINSSGTLVANNGITGNLTGNVTGTVSDISNHDTDSLSEGTTNLYYTDARADARVNLQTGINLSLSSKTTDDLIEGSTSLYYTDARARGAVSASGDLAYNSTTGVISFTERTDSEVNSLADARIALQVGSNLDLSAKSTSDLSEGTNLYYTNARADARIALNTGANLDLSSKDSDDLAEGTSNLYFTNERVDDRVNSLLVAGSSKITLSYNDVANTLTIDNGNAYFQGIAGTSNQITSSHTLGAYTLGLTPTVDVTTRLRINNTSSSEAFAVTGNSDLEGDLSVTGRIFEVGETSQTFDNANNGTAANNIDISQPVNFMNISGSATGDVYLHLPKGADGQIINLILSPSYSSFYTIYIADTGTYQTNMYGTASFSSYQRTLRLRYSNAAGKWMNLGGDAYVSY